MKNNQDQLKNKKTSTSDQSNNFTSVKFSSLILKLLWETFLTAIIVAAVFIILNQLSNI